MSAVVFWFVLGLYNLPSNDRVSTQATTTDKHGDRPPTDERVRGQGLEEGNDPGPVHAADGAGVVPVRGDGLAVWLVDVYVLCI